MIADDQYTFLKRRQEFEEAYYASTENEDIIKTISVVDINTIDLCNRTCVFCPRHDPSVYPNRNLAMTAQGAEIIAKKLADIDYSGTIAISGFGENLLNAEIIEIIKALKTHNPKSFVECNTNGDPLTQNLASRLFEAGLDCLNINLYDGPHQIEKFNQILVDIPDHKYKYRGHWNTDDYGIIFNNRSGIIKWFDHKTDHADLKATPCYYPFYKLFVDWNGDVLFCANDWGRTRIVGNLLQQSVYDVWMSKGMQKVRRRLSTSGRTFRPCDTCDVKGTLLGKQSYERLINHEDRSNR